MTSRMRGRVLPLHGALLLCSSLLAGGRYRAAALLTTTWWRTTMELAAAGGAANSCRAADRVPLLELGPSLVRAIVVRRPSERNRSPYVGDVRLPDGRIAMAHMPALDMGGKCVAGAEVLLKVAVDRKGRPVGADALGKHGTPKCEYIMQLLRVEDPENAHLGGCWVGAHPSIGEKVAAALLGAGALDAALGSSLVGVQREVANPAGCDMRCDFVATGACGRRWVIEVKTVVDSDYNPATAPSRKGCVFLGHTVPYERAAIFPWGNARQKGLDGERVVSARAIKHVHELALLARGERTEADGTRLGAALVFVVVRADALSFRPNAEACPSFAQHLREAHAAGVTVVARRVSWSDSGEAFDEGEIPVRLSDSTGDGDS